MDLTFLSKELSRVVSEGYDPFFESIIYLDSEKLSAVFSGLTGVKGRPSVEVQEVSGEVKVSFVASLGASGKISQSYEISDSYLLKAILPKLKDLYPSIKSSEDICQYIKQKIWLEGITTNKTYLLPGTPIRNQTIKRTSSKFEFRFERTKCALFFNPEYIDSIYRPLIAEERSFEEHSTMLGYIHDYKEEKNNAEKIFLATITPIIIFKNIKETD